MITFVICYFLVLDIYFLLNTKNGIPIQRMIRSRRKSNTVQIGNRLYVCLHKNMSRIKKLLQIIKVGNHCNYCGHA